MSIRRLTTALALTLLVAQGIAYSLAHADEPWLRPYEGPSRDDINTKTLRRKVMCGYQGWFRAPGDGAAHGWVHWSRNGSRITPESLTFEMWPDMSELGDDEKFAADGFTYPDGSQAHLFSSAHPKTVERHFEQMRTYGIDGVFLQRFLVEVGDRDGKLVLANVRAAAHKSGRAFAITYDMTSMPSDRIFDTLTTDWKWLVDEVKITKDSRYLHHNGKPVLMVYGFFTDRFGADLANRIIDFFKTKGPYEVTLIGGCQWHWRAADEREWAAAFRRFDVIMPWNVGNTTKQGDVTLASTGHWPQDQLEARRSVMAFMPVVYPGFSWDNLQRKRPGSTNIPRLKGNFLWQQFRHAAALETDAIYVAMFDEVDEATAIFKVTNEPPKEAHFVTYEGLPSDWYLRLTGEASKLYRAGRGFPAEIPIRPAR